MRPKFTTVLSKRRSLIGCFRDHGGSGGKTIWRIQLAIRGAHFIVLSRPRRHHTTAASTTMSANVRGCNNTPEDDCVLAHVWIRLSEYPLVGVEQKDNNFYEKAWARYKTCKPVGFPLRPLASVMMLIELIVNQFVRFSAFYSSYVTLRPTVVNEDDLNRITKAIFNGRKIKDPTGEIGKPMEFRGAWNILRNHE